MRQVVVGRGHARNGDSRLRWRRAESVTIQFLQWKVLCSLLHCDLLGHWRLVNLLKRDIRMAISRYHSLFEVRLATLHAHLQ